MNQSFKFYINLDKDFKILISFLILLYLLIFHQHFVLYLD